MQDQTFKFQKDKSVNGYNFQNLGDYTLKLEMSISKITSNLQDVKYNQPKKSRNLSETSAFSKIKRLKKGCGKYFYK